MTLCCTDHKKLPFMAMLRNLRNLIKAGISSKHHTAVIRRLTDEVGQGKYWRLEWKKGFSMVIDPEI